MPDPLDPTRARPLASAEVTCDHAPGEKAAKPVFVASAQHSSDGYRLGEEIARGGMGVVCRATDTVLGREVAVKLLHEKYADGSDAARRFLTEARITGRLQHPAIPPVHDLGFLPDGRPFLAMKLIRGRTLAAELAARPTPSHDRGRFVAVFAQICQAVAYAHANGTIHRDLKPLNVMVGAFGEVQVMDWGLAKELKSVDSSVASAPAPASPESEPDPNATTDLPAAAEAATDETRAGAVIGTPAYMPPEQARGLVEQVDRRSDVFALGAILCVVLTGEPPYGRGARAEILDRAVEGDLGPAFDRLDASDADADLVALCKRCLSVAPGQRPADGAEVATAVAEHQAAADERRRRAELERAASEAKAEERRRRQRVQLALLGAVVLLAVAAGFGAVVASLWRTSEANRADAETQRDAADAARAKLAGFEYGGAMRVAHQEWRDGNLAAMRALLDGSDPKLRGWEWPYLNRLHDSSLLTLRGHADRVTAAAFSEDRTRIVTASRDGTAKVWDARTGAEVVAFHGHDKPAEPPVDPTPGQGVWRKDLPRPVHSAAFSPDGSQVCTGGDTDTALVWDAKTGAEAFALRHKSVVQAVSYSADGTRIVTGSHDRTAKVWDAKTGAELLTITHASAVLAASFSADGARLVTGSFDGTAKVWNATTGLELLTLPKHRGHVTSASFSPDGKRICTGGWDWDNTAKVWDAATGAEALTLSGHKGRVVAAAFSADGTRIVTGSNDLTARVWDARTGVETLVLKGHLAPVTSVAFSKEGTRVVTGSGEFHRPGEAKVWDAHTGAEALTLGRHTEASSASLDSDGTRVVIGHGVDAAATVLDSRTGLELLALKCHADSVLAASFSADGTRIVTGSADKTAKVWDARTGAELLNLQGHEGAVATVTFSPDGARLVTASSDGAAKIWDAKTGAVLRTLGGHLGSVHAASFSPDGARIVTASHDRTAKVWDATTGVETLALVGHANDVLSASFSADGTRILTASLDHTAKIWDAKTGTATLTLKGHTEGVRAATFNGDSTRAVTGSDDLTVRLWDTKTGAEVLTLRGHVRPVRSARFSADGTRIVTCDGTVNVWDSRSLRDSRPPEAAP